MTKSLLPLLLSLFLGWQLHAQQAQLLFDVDGQKVYTDEFEHFYQKNKRHAENDTREKFLDRFVLFHQKLAEARRLGLEKQQALMNERTSYLHSLMPLFTFDSQSRAYITQRLYQRLLQQQQVQQFFVRIPATTTDTLPFYQRALAAHRAATAGGDFDKIVAQQSDSPDAATRMGHLGWLSARDLPFKAEGLVWACPEGRYTPIVRLDEGYYFYRVNAKRPHPGSFQIAHILRLHPADSTDSVALRSAQNTLDTISIRLQSKRASFAELALQYSEDESTRFEGGILPWASPGGLLPELEAAAFACPNLGDISQPVYSRFGWHIVQLVGRSPLAPYEQMQASLEEQIKGTDYLKDAIFDYVNQQLATMRFKKRFKDSDLLPLIDNSVCQPNWMPKVPYNGKKTVMKLNGKSYPLQLLMNKLMALSGTLDQQTAHEYLQVAFQALVTDEVIAHYNQHVSDNPELVRMTNDYHAGNLVFQVLEQEVWTKARRDTAAIAQYFAQNRIRYQRPAQIEFTLFQATSIQHMRRAKELAQQHPTLTEEQWIDSLGASADSLQRIDRMWANAEQSSFIASLINAWENDDKTTVDYDGGRGLVYFVQTFQPKEPASLPEVRNEVEEAYLQQIERTWLDTVRKRFPAKIDPKGQQRALAPR